MDARTRDRLPVLPVLVRTTAERRKAAEASLAAARQARPGETFTAAGQTLTRSILTKTAPARIWADDPGTGKDGQQRRDESSSRASLPVACRCPGRLPRSWPVRSW